MRRKTKTTTFWKIESRWLTGSWLSRVMKLKFKLMVCVAQKQLNLHCKNLKKTLKLTANHISETGCETAEVEEVFYNSLINSFPLLTEDSLPTILERP